MEYDKLVGEVNQIDLHLANNVNSVLESFQKFHVTVKAALNDINKTRKGKDAIARLKSLYVELGGRDSNWGNDLSKETRRGANAKEKTKTTKSSGRILKEISSNEGAADDPKITVKIERMTLCQESEMQLLNKELPVTIKQEKIDTAISIKKEKSEMLPPTETVVKKGAVPKKKQIARTKTRTTRNQNKESDVILQEPETVTLDLLKEVILPQVTDVKRSTRTKTKKLLEEQNAKRIRSPSTDSQQTPQNPQAKRVKSNISKSAATSSESEAYQTPKSDFDTKNSPEQNNKDKPVVMLVPLRKSVLDKYRVKNISENTNSDNDVQKKVEEVASTNLADIMTDDESTEEMQEVKTIEEKEKSKIDQISLAKKIVETSEKIAGKVITDTPVQRVTRTKTRNLAKTKMEEIQTPVKAEQNREVFTPILDERFMPRSISTAKIHKKMPTLQIPLNTLSAIKASQKELRELEERRQKKEAEMAKKREAILQAAKEERNRRQLEKEIMLQQKQKEDAEKRKLLAKQRSEERRREEEMRRAEEEKLKKLQEKEKERLELQKIKATTKTPKKKLPIYMVEKAPLLPSYDCYDSDDPEAKTSNVALQRPDWTRSLAMHISLKTMLNIDDKMKNTLFCPAPETPDLEEIFENIDPKKLRRNSSAIWNHQPRFTRMPSFHEDF